MSHCLASTVVGFASIILAADVPALAQSVASGNSHPRVLQVGAFKGRTGSFSTIQSAVNAAAPGDWILVGPGVYHENGGPHDGVLITTPNIHMRGMDRNAVTVDGTNSTAETCSSDQAAQVLSANGGRNGIEILKVDGVSVENLTVCNFLSDADGDRGNQIFWNGGDDSGAIGLGSYHGAYLGPCVVGDRVYARAARLSTEP